MKEEYDKQKKNGKTTQTHTQNTKWEAEVEKEGGGEGGGRRRRREN